MHKVNLAIVVPHEESLEFIIYNRAMDNTATRNEIIYKLRSIDERYKENYRVHSKSGN